MVQLLLLSPKGNQGTRYFPYSGYLGLTPIKVDGGQYNPLFSPCQSNHFIVVKTKLDQDAKLLAARDITVAIRCYESRIGKTGISHSNILAEYSQILWSKPEDQDYADIGELEFPFRIVVPVKTPGFSYATYQDYRVVWRVEASAYNNFHSLTRSDTATSHKSPTRAGRRVEDYQTL